jgi:tripartite-type tricarboxylate transporter receptor subunit TctC
MNSTRRQAFRLGISFLATNSFAQGVGAKPITVIVPFAPGGNVDITARAVTLQMTKIFDQSVIVDNRAGASGAIGSALVARAQPDGNTLLAATPGQLGTLPHLFKTPYQLTDFVPIGVVSKTSIAIVVKKGNPRFGTVEELVVYAKANPGQVTVGHSGAGSPNHLAMLQFESSAGCRFSPVAYRGSGPALIDLLSGQIDLMFDQVSSSLQHIKSGGLVPILILGLARDQNIPTVRTVKEAGLTEFDASTYVGLMAPKNVPAPVLSRLVAAVERAAADTAFGATLREVGSSAHYIDGKRFAEILKADEAVAMSLIKQGRLVNE